MMSDNLIEVADHLIDLCVREVERCTHLRIPHDVMAGIIVSSRLLQEELKNYGFYTEHLDTFTRDDLLDAVAARFTTLGRWPLNMDTERTSTTFFKELIENAGEVGCEYVEPDGSVTKIVRGRTLS